MDWIHRTIRGGKEEENSYLRLSTSLGASIPLRMASHKICCARASSILLTSIMAVNKQGKLDKSAEKTINSKDEVWRRLKKGKSLCGYGIFDDFYHQFCNFWRPTSRLGFFFLNFFHNLNCIRWLFLDRPSRTLSLFLQILALAAPFTCSNHPLPPSHINTVLMLLWSLRGYLLYEVQVVRLDWDSPTIL